MKKDILHSGDAHRDQRMPMLKQLFRAQEEEYLISGTVILLGIHPLQLFISMIFGLGLQIPNNTSVVISFDYKRDDVLKITEQGTAIIKINSLKLEACGKEGKNSLVML